MLNEREVEQMAGLIAKYGIGGVVDWLAHTLKHDIEDRRRKGYTISAREVSALAALQRAEARLGD